MITADGCPVGSEALTEHPHALNPFYSSHSVKASKAFQVLAPSSTLLKACSAEEKFSSK